MRREEWYLVINALLPLVEGVLVDVVFADEAAPRQARAQKSVDKLKGELGDPLFYGPLVRGIEMSVLPAGSGLALFGGFDQQDYGVAGEPRSLNRHAILHGAARRYGSRQNAMKLYLLLVMMAECLNRYDRNRREAASTSS